MRIRDSAFNPSSSSSSSSSSSHLFSSTSPPPPPPFSSSTSPSSLASSSLNSSPSIDCKTCYEGLDLLVKAVLHVAGTVIFDIPFAPANAIRKGKRTFRFKRTVVTEIQKEKEENKTAKKKKDVGIELLRNPKGEKGCRHFLPSTKIRFYSLGSGRPGGGVCLRSTDEVNHGFSDVRLCSEMIFV